MSGVVRLMSELVTTQTISIEANLENTLIYLYITKIYIIDYPNARHE